jgi:Xaa-Pro aminopeptidase
MILSNEPGYYKTGAYGIRIENLVLVEKRAIAGAEGDWLGFETLTLAPIEKALLDRSLSERRRYRLVERLPRAGSRVLAPQLEGDALAWLEDACALL